MKKGLGNLFITTSGSHFFNKTDFKQYLLTITKNTCIKINCLVCRPEVESSRTFLVSRTHFEVLGFEGQVLGFGLEASSPRTLSCPRLENSTCFWNVEFCRSLEKIFEDVFYWRTPEKNFWRPFFWKHLRSCPWSLVLVSSIPVLGLERVCPRKDCPWPWIFLCPWPLALCPRFHLWFSRLGLCAFCTSKKGV